ncbi:MAG: SAM-dependent methyltransferase [Bacteroidia bacterium]
MNTKLNLDDALVKEGMAYAEKNFLSENSHLELDKAFINQYYDLNGKRVLDFGCGMGGMTLWMAKHYNCRITGIDIDSHHIEIANLLKAKHGMDEVDFLLQNVVEHPIDEKFDYIFLNDVAEHIRPDYLVPIFTQLGNQLKEGGVIFVSYPPWEGPYASHLNRVIPIPWSQYLPNFILMPLLKKRNIRLVGESDLLGEYLQLNHLNHTMLKGVIEKAGLRIERRRSHSKINRVIKNLNLNFWPFRFLITKELVALSVQ